ncbi:hypothetical protein VPH35_136403 [Triticum aestivum]|uniref:uncharacterized protein n=1 Tax=Triticum aestivum TaxID=4565 RepID=UPI001D013CAC|nr:uncharacterized protein LOC123171002 [Triticum aestivum]XP_045087301.1 uncharacterized protein LOC120969283 [Aegilops tauschii subsp. strangulata]
MLKKTLPLSCSSSPPCRYPQKFPKSRRTPREGQDDPLPHLAAGGSQRAPFRPSALAPLLAARAAGAPASPAAVPQQRAVRSTVAVPSPAAPTARLLPPAVLRGPRRCLRMHAVQGRSREWSRERRRIGSRWFFSRRVQRGTRVQRGQQGVGSIDALGVGAKPGALASLNSAHSSGDG